MVVSGNQLSPSIPSSFRGCSTSTRSTYSTSTSWVLSSFRGCHVAHLVLVFRFVLLIMPAWLLSFLGKRAQFALVLHTHSLLNACPSTCPSLFGELWQEWPAIQCQNGIKILQKLAKGSQGKFACLDGDLEWHDARLKRGMACPQTLDCLCQSFCHLPDWTTSVSIMISPTLILLFVHLPYPWTFYAGVPGRYQISAN